MMAGKDGSTKHIVAEETVTGEERCPTKRKAKEVPVAGSAAAAAGNQPERAAAIGQILDLGADAAAVGSDGKFRLPDDQVRFILALKREVPSIEDLDGLSSLSLFPPEWIEKSRQQHKEVVALFEKIDDDFEVFQKQVRDQWLKLGYVEVDYDYLANMANMATWIKEEWRKMDFSRIQVAAPDDEDGVIPYVPEEDESLNSGLDVPEEDEEALNSDSRALESN